MVHSILTLLALDMIFQTLHKILEKNKQNPKATAAYTWDPEVNGPHLSVKQRQGMVVDQPLLVDGEATSGEVTIAALSVTSRAQGYPWFGRRSTGACLPATMVDGGGCTAVRRQSPATICSSDGPYGSTVLQRS